MAAASRPMLDPADLNRGERALLDELQHHPMTAAYIAEQTHYTSSYIRNRLNELEKHGVVKPMGGQMWRLVNDPRHQTTTDDPTDTRQPADQPEFARDRDTDVRNAIEKLDITEPMHGDIRERYDALEAAYWALIDGKATKRSEFESVYEEHTAGYGTFKNWWDRLVSPELRKLPDVEYHGGRRNPWDVSK